MRHFFLLAVLLLSAACAHQTVVRGGNANPTQIPNPQDLQPLTFNFVFTWEASENELNPSQGFQPELPQPKRLILAAAGQGIYADPDSVNQLHFFLNFEKLVHGEVDFQVALTFSL